MKKHFVRHNKKIRKTFLSVVLSLVAATTGLFSMPSLPACAADQSTIMTKEEFWQQSLEDLQDFADMAVENYDILISVMPTTPKNTLSYLQRVQSGELSTMEDIELDAIYGMYTGCVTILQNSQKTLTPVFQHLNTYVKSYSDFVLYVARTPARACKLVALIGSLPVVSVVNNARTLVDVMKAAMNYLPDLVSSTVNKLNFTDKLASDMYNLITGYYEEKSSYYIFHSRSVGSISVMDGVSYSNIENTQALLNAYFEWSEQPVCLTANPMMLYSGSGYFYMPPYNDWLEFVVKDGSLCFVRSNYATQSYYAQQYYYSWCGNDDNFSTKGERWSGSVLFSELLDGDYQFFTPNGTDVYVYKSLQQYQNFTSGTSDIYIGAIAGGGIGTGAPTSTGGFSVSGDYIGGADIEHDYRNIQTQIINNSNSSSTVTGDTVTNIVNNYYTINNYGSFDPTSDPGSGSGSGGTSGGGSSNDNWLQTIVSGLGSLLSGLGSLFGVVLGFFGDVITMISDLLVSLKDSLAELTGVFDGFVDFLADSFRFIPSEVWASITLAFTAYTVVFIIKAFRG